MSFFKHILSPYVPGGRLYHGQISDLYRLKPNKLNQTGPRIWAIEPKIPRKMVDAHMCDDSSKKEMYFLVF